MRRVFASLGFVAVTVTALTYAAFAFVLMRFNPADWSLIARASAVLVIVCLAVVIAVELTPYLQERR